MVGKEACGVVRPHLVPAASTRGPAINPTIETADAICIKRCAGFYELIYDRKYLSDLCLMRTMREPTSATAILKPNHFMKVYFEILQTMHEGGILMFLPL